MGGHDARGPGGDNPVAAVRLAWRLSVVHSSASAKSAISRCVSLYSGVMTSLSLARPNCSARALLRVLVVAVGAAVFAVQAGADDAAPGAKALEALTKAFAAQDAKKRGEDLYNGALFLKSRPETTGRMRDRVYAYRRYLDELGRDA